MTLGTWYICQKGRKHFYGNGFTRWWSLSVSCQSSKEDLLPRDTSKNMEFINYFDEIFSPIVKMTLSRPILTLIASKDIEVIQMDVKIAFLQG